MVPATDPSNALGLVYRGQPAYELESQILDFKEEASERKKAVKDLVGASVCFANAEGGTIFLGVRDKVGGPTAFSGTTLSVEEAKSRIFELTKPHLLVDVLEVIFEEGATKARLLQIDVPDSSTVHSDTQGRFTMRVGSDCLPMDQTQQVAARERKSSLDWSARAGTYEISDVSTAAEGLARDRLRSLSDFRSDLAQFSTPDLLRALGVVGDDERLLAAAEVLFVPADTSSSPRLVYQYRDTPGGEPTTVERLYGPLVSVLARVMELVQARRRLTPVTLPTGQQLQVEDFPELAVREAIANGLFHRDYHVSDSVTVEHSPEVFVVSSPGPLLPGITPENILTHPSLPRNPKLTHAAQILGLVEEVGRGVDRMYREMVRSGQGLPTIESSEQRVRVTLVGGAPNKQLARYVAELPDAEREDVGVVGDSPGEAFQDGTG
jgi:ATP-dependent DNA helicase RecG